MVKEGDTVPSFVLQDQNEATVRIEDERGRWVVLWWYPKASTRGWTIEGQGFRDRTPQYNQANATILGISFDTPAENKTFADNEKFPYRLLSDVERSLGGTFDVVRTEDEGNPDYPRRKTFLIDPEGTIRKIYTVTDTAAHPEEVLADINQMSAAG